MSKNKGGKEFLVPQTSRTRGTRNALDIDVSQNLNLDNQESFMIKRIPSLSSPIKKHSLYGLASQISTNESGQ
jgi:hypothetical protein